MLKQNIYSKIVFEFSIRGVVHSTSWIFSLYFVYIFKTDWKLLFKFSSSDSSFDRIILRSLFLKFKTSAHAQIAIYHYYVLFTNYLPWYEFETWGYILINKVSNWFYQLDYVTFHKNVFWPVNCILFVLPNLLHPNVNFITAIKVDISNEVLH